MKFSSRSDERGVAYESVARVESESFPGVSFTVLRMSFGRRMELFRLIHEVAARLPFLETSGEFREQVEANLLNQEIDNLYLRWGLARVDGLSIDGEPATIESVIEKGPEALSREIAAAVKGQCGLSEDERKN